MDPRRSKPPGKATRLRRTVACRAQEAATATKEKDEAAEKEKAVEPEEDEPFFEEVSGDDPLVLELEERLRKMNGNSELTLDMVLNPGTIVNTEMEVILLKAELKATPEEETGKIKELEDKIEQKQMKIVNEMRQVMTDNLKLEFLAQAILSVPVFWSFCYETWPFYPDWKWLDLTDEGTRLVFKLIGYWGVWLVTVPALRARKPGGPYGMGYEEKRALDISILILPFVAIFAPFLSSDPGAGFWISLVIVAGLYIWSFNTPLVSARSNRRGASKKELGLPDELTWLLQALDFGTGMERGADSEDNTWQDQLSDYDKAADELLKAKKKREEEKAKKQEPVP